MNRKKIADILNIIFGWGMFVVLIAGGLAFFGFLVGIIMGGESATTLAVFIQKQYFPVVIKVASVIIGIGLIGMYFGKIQALSLTSDKKEADEELASIQQDQNKA